MAVLTTGGDVPTALGEANACARKHDSAVVEWTTGKTLSDLALDEGMVGWTRGMRPPPIGYTYKCLGAAFWAPREWHRHEVEEHDDLGDDRFHDILSQVILAGGDADTNGAVAGAILGAVGGFDFPEALVTGIPQEKRVILDEWCTRVQGYHARR